MVDWRRVPWTLWLVAVLFLVSTVRIELLGATRLELRLLVVPFTLVWIYLLFRGFRRIWIGTIALFLVSIAISLVIGRPPGVLRGTVDFVELALLVLPVTRRFFSSEARR